MFREVNFEISGICNAKCPWCITGNKNINRISNGKFINPKEFENAIEYMINEKIIDKTSVIYLYNWGEPFLNPRLKEIIEILNNFELHFGLSTNASINMLFNKDNFLKNLKSITFSMPGFSQRSYNKIHGFKFENIKGNIQEMLLNFREYGFKGTAIMAYHVYQFNEGEIFEASRFCDENEIIFSPYYAYFNGYSMFSSYMNNAMNYNKLKEASKDLITYYYSDKLNEKPNNYICPQFDYLTLDEECNVLTCCAIDKEYDDYSIGKLYDLSVEEIVSGKKNRVICRECNDLGINYLAHNPLRYNFERKKYNEFLRKEKVYEIFKDLEDTNVGIYGTGNHTVQLILEYLRYFSDKNIKFYYLNSNNKLNPYFMGNSVWCPNDIEKLNLNKIIISSYEFQEEIYKLLKRKTKSTIDIIKIYNEKDECIFY